MLFRRIIDEKLSQYAYLVGCQRTGEALLIDPERDIDRYTVIAAEEDLTITAVTETHIHADFLSGTREFAESGVSIYLSAEGGPDWSYRWPGLGSYDVTLLRDGDTFTVGNVEVKAVFTPGHTPEHLSFLITDVGGGATEPMGMASGDFVFVGDTGRPDLLESAAGVEGAMQEGAHALFRSVQRFLELPDYLQVWPGHGAGSACGKALGAVPESTVGYERRFSPALFAAQVGEEPFVEYVLDAQPEPPLYFGRMKRQNRDGPDLLGAIPQPKRVTASELAGLMDRGDSVIVDTRQDRSDFMKAHIPGSLYGPLDRSFPTIMGSFVEPETAIYLVVEAAAVEEATRSLIRIGLDRVAGYMVPRDLAAWVEQGGAMEGIEEIDTLDLEDRRSEPGTLVLDVRTRAEFSEAHVPGSLNVADTRLLDRIDEVPRNRTLLVYCRSGARAAAASAMLAHHGFETVYVNGFFQAWLDHHGQGAQEGASAG